MPTQPPALLLLDECEGDLLTRGLGGVGFRDGGDVAAQSDSSVSSSIATGVGSTGGSLSQKRMIHPLNPRLSQSDSSVSSSIATGVGSTGGSFSSETACAAP